MSEEILFKLKRQVDELTKSFDSMLKRSASDICTIEDSWFAERKHREELQVAHDALRAALWKIARYDDTGANQRLAATGSYGGFDEPRSVQIARAALKDGGG